ncbi:MAG: metallophosphoesterase [Acidobacteria bacterium]|nr:metallophosphoesterase [Acidobacteriota bacterium]
MKKKLTRRQMLGRTVLALGAAAAGYGFLIEPRRLVVERIEIRLRRLPGEFDGFRIAQVSDIHYGPFMTSGFVRKAVEEINRLRPDLVALTGDFISRPLGKSSGREGAETHAPPCADALRGLRSAFGAFAVLGNHDHWNHAGIVKDSLESAGFPVLVNQAVALEKDNARLWLAGVDDVMESKADLERALKRVPASEATLLLAHEPDYADYTSKFPIDLQLSGHSHGGQVRLPWLGAPVLPFLGRKYPMGRYRVGNLHLYTNRGFGVISPPVRFNCPPEITLVTLRAG